MKIVFFGTPDFAAETLKILYESGINISCVISSPSKQKGRGQKTSLTPVTKRSQELKIHTITPSNFYNDGLIKELQSMNVDLFVVVAFKMLPKEIWSIPKIGTINLHTSLLPEYRGAAPINRVLINGETLTGITTFFINDKIDCGDILMQEKIHLTENTTCAQLHNQLITLGSNLLIKTLKKLKKNDLLPIKQKKKISHYANKINKTTIKINWKKPAKDIHNLIRGLSPILSKSRSLKNNPICPGAWFCFSGGALKGIRIKLLLSKLDNNTNNKIGFIETDNKKFIKIHLLNGSILIENIQIAGKRIMEVSEFLAGYKIDKKWEIEMR